ncbi:DUF5990 family protein [Aquihabitans sp. McL0605]|uniref:DUF5990 family protein n=1 Tax=Aquihabitans sp. McL0605 TaxID=3415671 RepID=UPI003CF0B4C7
MLIRIEAHDLPGRTFAASDEPAEGHANVHVGVPRRGHPADLLDLTPGDAASAAWTTEVAVKAVDAGFDVVGPHIQGRPGDRFIYLSWGDVDGDGAFAMFRRAKVMLDGVPATTLAEAAGRGVLVGCLGLTDDKGGPRCAAVRPPLIEWLAAEP